MRERQQYTDLVAHLESCADRAVASADQILVRLGSWLVAGHAGGMLLCLNAALERRLPVSDVGSFFTICSIGMLSAFSGLVAARSSLLYEAQRQRLEAAALRSQSESQSDDEIKHCEVEARAGDFWMSLSLAVSAGAFLFAVNRTVLLIGSIDAVSR